MLEAHVSLVDRLEARAAGRTDEGEASARGRQAGDLPPLRCRAGEHDKRSEDPTARHGVTPADARQHARPQPGPRSDCTGLLARPSLHRPHVHRARGDDGRPRPSGPPAARALACSSRRRLAVGNRRDGRIHRVDGACLSVVERVPGRTGLREVDASSETLAEPPSATAPPGSAVNLERALRHRGRLGGHIVSGHVDASGSSLERRRSGESAAQVMFSVPAELARFVAPKGSITRERRQPDGQRRRARRPLRRHAHPRHPARTTCSRPRAGDAREPRGGPPSHDTWAPGWLRAPAGSDQSPRDA